jgi:hypothetical protein
MIGTIAAGLMETPHPTPLHYAVAIPGALILSICAIVLLLTKPEEKKTCQPPPVPSPRNMNSN